MKNIEERISVIYEAKHPNVSIPYNFIISKLEDPMEIIKEFDFGLCQIGMTTDGELLLTEAFLNDFNNKTITVVNARDKNRQDRRIARMKEKFPDWTIVDSSNG